MTIILMAAASSNGSNSDDDFDDDDEEMVRNEDKNAGFEIQMNQGGNVATKPEISPPKHQARSMIGMGGISSLSCRSSACNQQSSSWGKRLSLVMSCLWRRLSCKLGRRSIQVLVRLTGCLVLKTVENLWL